MRGMLSSDGASVSAPLIQLIHTAIERNGGWLPFDRYMSLALYAPGLGYYASGSRQFGVLPQSGSDFVTAPELSPRFGQALARQVAQALSGSGTDEVWEFGAGSGVLAAQLIEALDGLGLPPRRYTIVDVSGALRGRQHERLQRFGERVRWIDALPDEMQGVMVGNEVLDAMPVQLLRFNGTQWSERGVVSQTGGAFGWSDRATPARPPAGAPFGAGSAMPFVPGSITEIHPQAEAFIATLAERMTRGAAFFIDYGFPESEYYHLQRSGGTLMCHQAHRADADPLVDVGRKDITAHVNFTGIALAGQDAGLEVLGYTSQAHFLINCGVLDGLDPTDVKTIANTQKLLNEHEMGELFKVIGFAKGGDAAFRGAPLGFTRGDRTHTL